jgi:hypothetical protein
LGRIAELAETPSLIAVGDRASLQGRTIQVVGRIQYDYGLGPWDEYYIAFDSGSEWGWLAYAQGRWYVTQLVRDLVAPPRHQLEVDGKISLPFGVFCVAECRSATVISAEGELPSPTKAGTAIYYADAYGPNGAFATLDYGDGSEESCVFAGKMVTDAELSVTALGPRTIHKVKTTHLQCPNCGGDVPKLHEGRSERLGCPYCGAFSDIPAQKVLAQQERILQSPDIPIGTVGTLSGAAFTCLAFLRRSILIDDSRYFWEEYLLFSPTVGYRWLIKDPESGWSQADFVSPADIDKDGKRQSLRYANRLYRLRSTGQARVDFVLGEVYWKCSIGEVVSSADYAAGSSTISREADNEEVNYSHSNSLSWEKIAAAFGLPVKGAGGIGVPARSASTSSVSGCVTALVIVVLVILVVIVLSQALGSLGSGSGGPIFIGGGSYRGGGSYSGGK